MSLEIFDSTFNSLEKGVDRTSRVQEVIAQNVANANTPGYVPKKFDVFLNQAVEKQENKVNLEEEMAEMAKNNTEHSAYIKIMASKLSVLRTVVTQGRR